MIFNSLDHQQLNFRDTSASIPKSIP